MISKNKTLSLFFSLDPNEQQRFFSFLTSPYFAEKSKLAELFRFLVSAQPNQTGAQPAQFESDIFSVETIKWEICEALFPGDKYDDQTVRHVLSAFQKVMEKFLALEQYLKSPFQQKLYLLRQLREKGQSKAYEYSLRQTQNILETHPYRARDYHQWHYQLEEEYSHYLDEKKSRTFSSNLQSEINSLDQYYLLNKLKYACNILNNRNIVDFDYEMPLLDEIYAYLENNTVENSPAILVYAEIYSAFRNPAQEDHFTSAMAALEAHGNKFPPEEARDMYAFAQNYCIMKINQGKKEYLSHIFSLYKTVLSREIILERGLLSPWDFKNIVVTGLRREAYDWVEDFIETYKDKIPSEFQENAYTYNRARLHFYRREYSQTLRLLQQVEYEDVFYNLDSKVMLLKIYYELRELASLDSLIDSFRIFLRRNKLISEHHRTNYLNLVKYVRKMSRIRPGDFRKLKNIKENLSKVEQIADLDWLNEQILSLEGR